MSVAASVVNWAHEQALPVGLYANGLVYEWGFSLRLPPARGDGVLVQALEGLARLQTGSPQPLWELMAVEVPALPYGTSLVVISRQVGPELAGAILRAQRSGRPVTLVLTGAEHPRRRSCRACGSTVWAERRGCMARFWRSSGRALRWLLAARWRRRRPSRGCCSSTPRMARRTGSRLCPGPGSRWRSSLRPPCGHRAAAPMPPSAALAMLAGTFLGYLAAYAVQPGDLQTGLLGPTRPWPSCPRPVPLVRRGPPCPGGAGVRPAAAVPGFPSASSWPASSCSCCWARAGRGRCSWCSPGPCAALRGGPFAPHPHA